MDENKDRGDNFEKPVSIYEVHLGSWKRVSNDENGFHTYRELADELVEYVKEMDTHIFNSFL